MAIHRPAAIGAADRDRHRAQLRLVKVDDPAPAHAPPPAVCIDAPSEPPQLNPAAARVLASIIQAAVARARQDGGPRRRTE